MSLQAGIVSFLIISHSSAQVYHNFQSLRKTSKKILKITMLQYKAWYLKVILHIYLKSRYDTLSFASCFHFFLANVSICSRDLNFPSGILSSYYRRAPSWIWTQTVDIFCYDNQCAMIGRREDNYMRKVAKRQWTNICLGIWWRIKAAFDKKIFSSSDIELFWFNIRIPSSLVLLEHKSIFMKILIV